MINGGRLMQRSRNGGSYVIDEHLVLIALPLRAIDILRNGRTPARSIALQDDAAGTIFEKNPICTFNAAAIPDEPPAIEDVEALRLGGFENKPTGKILCLLIKLPFSTCQFCDCVFFFLLCLIFMKLK